MKLYKNQSGFSIIEILIATTIFSIGLLAVAGLQGTSIKGNATARAQTEVVNFGQGVIEELMTRSYDHADLNVGTHPTIVNGIYSYSWTVVEDDALQNTKSITVNISWTDQMSNHTTSLIFTKADII